MPYKDPEKRRERDRRLKQAVIDRIHAHLGGKCAVCGTTERLEIHHKDPEQKSYNFAQRWTKRWEEHLVELAKCELRCFTHHKAFHEALHGTLSKYVNNDCRCDACVKAYRIWDAEKHRRYRFEAAEVGMQSAFAFRTPLSDRSRAKAEDRRRRVAAAGEPP